MRSFQRASTLDPGAGDVVGLLRAIDRSVGSEARHLDQLPQLLGALRDQARVESITASSAIEGIVVDDSRVPSLASGAVGGWRRRCEPAGSRAVDGMLIANAGDVRSPGTL
jgi:hypothetical protein